MNILHLNVSYVEYHAVLQGNLKTIQRTTGMLWSRILQGRQFDLVRVKYTDEDTGEKSITERRWNGYEISTVLSHKRKPVQVFAIRVGSPL